MMPAVCPVSSRDASVTMEVDRPHPPVLRFEDVSHPHAVELAIGKPGETFAKLFRAQTIDGRRQVRIERGTGEDIAHTEHTTARADRQGSEEPAIVHVAELLPEPS